MAVEYDHIGAPITPDGPLPPFNSPDRPVGLTKVTLAE